MNDFDNSLPSNSNFFDSSKYNSSRVLRASWHSEDDRGQSPPPPPPLDIPSLPLQNQAVSDLRIQRNMNAIHNINGQDSQKEEKNEKKRTGPFPFLKKFSRKEPSAKNKSAARKPTVGDGASCERSRIDAPIVFNNSSSSHQTFRNTDKKFNEDGEEILQQGSGYWGLDTSTLPSNENLHNNTKKNNNNNVRENSYSTARDDVRSSLASTSSIRFRNNLAAGVEDFRKELEEFEMIERQLEGLAFDDDEEVVGYSTRSIRGSGVHLDKSSTINMAQDKDSSSYLNSTQTFRNTNLRAPLTGDRNTQHESEISWGAVTQPVPSIIPDRSMDSLNYTSSYENKVRHSSSAAAAATQPLPYSHFDKPTRSSESNVSSQSSFSFPSRSNHESVETADSEGVHIIRTRPLSGNRGQSGRGGGSGSAPVRGSQSSAPHGRAGGPQQQPLQQEQQKQHSNDAIPPTLALKAKELEEELETYRNENSALKKLRKQQETTLADIVQQREQAIKWAAEERQKTAAWCEDQRQLIAKERRLAAKTNRDAKEKTLSTTSTTRREKTEIEGLQAALHKAKIDHEASAKKWKSNETRLYSLIKDHSKHIEDLERKITTLEEEKLLLLEFIQESNLHIPKHIRAKLQNTLLNASLSAGKPPAVGSDASAAKSRATTPTQRRPASASYVEEVDVDIVPSASSTVHRRGSDHGRGKDADVSRSSSMRLSRPSSAVDDGKLSKTLGASIAHPKRTDGNALMASTSSWSRSSGRYSLGSEDLDAADTEDQDMNDGMIDTAMNDHGYEVYSGKTDHNTGVFKQSSPRFQESKPNLAFASNAARQSADALLVRPTDSNLSSTATTASNHQSGLLANNTSSHRISTLEAVDNNTGGVVSGLDSTTRQSIRGAAGDIDMTRSLSSSNTMQHSLSTTNKLADGSQGNIASRSGDSTNLMLTSNNASSSSNNNSRVEEILPTGAKLIRYANGTTKEISLDGRSAMVRFTNGDYKHTDTASGVVIYYYKLADTTHTTYKDGMEVYEFPNKQIEKHYPSGVKEILFPDSTKKLIRPDGVQESFFPDGVVLRELPDGKKEVLNNKLKS